MPKVNRIVSLVWILPLAILLPATQVSACPFCSAVSQTLRQEMATMDAAVIAESIPGEVQNTETGMIRMRVVEVLTGGDYVEPKQVVTPVYYGKVGDGRRFLLFGVDPPNLQWSLMPITERGEKYIRTVSELPDDPVQRLRFFYDFLEDEEPMLARDAYDEFAITPYDAVKAIEDQMDHDQLVEWIQDPEMPADRKRLYLTLLGVCGGPDDLPLLEEMLRSEQKRGGLDAMVACYLTLSGEPGLELIDELFLANKKAPYTDTYAAIMAIRFHGTEGDVIPRSALLPSLHHILERPELADLVISDLARWGDWSQIDRVTELFVNATEDNNFVRVPVVNYLRACPEPEAEAALKRLEEIDPESVRRSNIFFAKPIADPKPGPKETSSTGPAASQPIAVAANPAQLARSGQAVADAHPLAAVAAGGMVPAGLTRRATGSVANRLAALNVVMLALATMLIVAWLTLTSGAPAVAGSENQ
ncbi:hypothetical protein [Roseimaritima sediminicola]|uniref:hypothetical protein n=1 Tax=Roseimaritima sediminicola TaxID=2662066 RepID=UPI00192A332C|nr:hypothetical protein [Roseimaritima sediminicola]